jgi:histidinol-phosphate aminotransferase
MKLEVVDLSDNTNLWGTPPAARSCMHDASSRVSRYPSPYSADLKRAIAAYVGAGAEDVVVGCGSDDVLDSAMRAFAAPGDSIAYSTPTFSMIPVLARLNGLLPAEVPLRDVDHGYDIDADRLLDACAKIIYLCAPNNPTATPISREALVHVIQNAAGLVILDEAYAEFAGISYIDLATRHEHVLVTRTLSKAFGLAGLRVGYGVGAPELVSFVERARGPYKVSAPAERAALAALAMGDDGVGWVETHVQLARDTRERFRRELMTLGLDPLPSSANFILVPHTAAESLGARLRRDGVLVRVVTGLPESIRAFAAANGNALRIGVGPWPLMLRALELLGSALS